METENKKSEIETIHNDIIHNLQSEIAIRKKIYNFRKQLPHMLSTLTALQRDKVQLEKRLSKIEAVLYIHI